MEINIDIGASKNALFLVKINIGQIITGKQLKISINSK